MENFIARIKIIIKEVGNFIGNILVPFVSLLIAILGLFPVPTTWLEALKKVEVWLFNFAGTAKDIETQVVEEKVEHEKKVEQKLLKKALKEKAKAAKVEKVD